MFRYQSFESLRARFHDPSFYPIPVCGGITSPHQDPIVLVIDFSLHNEESEGKVADSSLSLKVCENEFWIRIGFRIGTGGTEGWREGVGRRVGEKG